MRGCAHCLGDLGEEAPAGLATRNPSTATFYPDPLWPPAWQVRVARLPADGPDLWGTQTGRGWEGLPDPPPQQVTKTTADLCRAHMHGAVLDPGVGVEWRTEG